MIEPARFVLETLSDGGLLLDLESGILFNLNRTAAFIWEQAIAGRQPVEIVSAMMGMFAVAPAIARADVEAALKLPQTEASPRPSSEFRYDAIDDGYRLSADGIPVLEISESRRALRALHGFNPAEIGPYLRALAPKLVALLGASVLHASAVARPDGGVVAFLGTSGAGKTTTARAFARAGWRLVCEDKLVLRPDGERLVSVIGGEARVVAWIAEARQRLVKPDSQDWCDASPLAEVLPGATQPVVGVILLGKERRNGTDIDASLLGSAQAAGEIFHHGFYGSPAAAEWRRQVRAAATIARTAQVFQATMPDGLDLLEQAARRYTEMTAS